MPRKTKDAPRYNYFRNYYEASQRPLSRYGRFHFRYLGFNFKDQETGRVYCKREYFDKYGDTLAPGFVCVPYEPEGGFITWEIAMDHYREADALYNSLIAEL